jgi:hypothetical protein
LLFLHDDSGAPHHHQPMPSDKAAGQYNTEPLWVLNHNTTFDVLVAGIGRIWPGKETAALFCGVHFLDEFRQVGGLMSHIQIATGVTNLIGPLGQSIQTYHNQPSVWLGFG